MSKPAQMGAGTQHGSRRSFVGDVRSRLAPEHAVQGRVHQHLVGICRSHRASLPLYYPVLTGGRFGVRLFFIRTAGSRCIGIQRRRIGASSSRVRSVAIPTALRTHVRIERSRGPVRPFGRRAAAHTRRLAEISAAPISRRGNASKNLRVNACSFQPTAETHRYLPSSFVASDVKHNELEGFSSVRTAFQARRNDVVG